MSDHSFKVVNGRTGEVVLFTESWTEASKCQYRNNDAEISVGYEPVFTLWVVDENAFEYRIELH